MALSRWGERVEKAMEPAVEPETTLGDAISKMAHDVEIEQTADLILEWFEKRFRRNYFGIKIALEWSEPHAWYVIELTWNPPGYAQQAPIVAIINISDEDITKHTTTPKAWENFLILKSREARTVISAAASRRGMILETGSSYETGLGGPAPLFKVSANTQQAAKAFAEMSRSLQEMSPRIDPLNRRFEKAAEVMEGIAVERAIESIKRSASGSDEAPAPE